MLPYADQMQRWSDDYAGAWAADDVLEDALAPARRLTAELVGEVEHAIDLGAGTGVYLAAIPARRRTWVDGSERMRDLARERLGDDVTYVVGDVSALASLGLERAQVVVTSRVVHDLPPDAHAAFYSAVFDLLEPGGFCFNLDHVAVPPEWDDLYRKLRAQRERPLAPHRDHPLASVGEHLLRLEEAGFDPTDVPWRLFGTALLAARRPL